jgi:hypothetical protein
MLYHKQVFDELDQRFAKILKILNQQLIKHQLLLINENHEYPKQILFYQFFC